MSTSTRAARAVAINPLAGARLRPGVGLSTAHLRRARNFPLNTQALAILVPLRSISTERHSVGAPPNAPPPGFDAGKAKKPLPKEESQAEAKKTSGSKKSDLDVELRTSNPSVNEPSAEPKTLTELAAKKEMDIHKKEEKQGKKLTLGQKIKHEVQHYWDGTKLLATEVRISTKLAIKMAAGYELTRRESRQLRRTVQDLARLVPFSAFVLVPFAELLLPIALKVFPNLLPSTYEDQKSKDKKATTLRTTRREVSSFLRSTLKETGLPMTIATTQREEFVTFFRKLRTPGQQPSAEDVIKVCQIFRDDLTLDNLSYPQLRAMCSYLNLNTFGTDMMLRYQIRHRMRQIKRDDKAISFEGVDSLTTPELQMACASRGIQTHAVSPVTLREQLQSWLDLRLKHGVPSTLLVLSNAYSYSLKNSDGSFNRQIDALANVLSYIPQELYHEMELEVSNAEGVATNKQRLEVLEEQQKLINKENQESQENEETGMGTPRDVDDIDEKEERQMLAEQQGLEKKQVGEAVDAEVDQFTEEQKMEARKNEK